MKKAIKSYLFHINSRLKSNKSLTLICAWNFMLLEKFFRKDFTLMNNDQQKEIDLVIPTISKDFDLLKEAIAGAKKNLRHKIGAIFVVSRNEPFIKDFCAKNGIVFVDELSVLGYGKNEITYMANGENRNGWMFQQLLKLSGEKFVKNENYLVIDSDTVLINPHTFIENDQFVFLQNDEWNEPYFRAFKYLFGYEAKTNLSYTSHMMIFNTKKLIEMKKELEKRHGMSWDKAYASTASPTEASCVSDYDTYANWVLCNYPKEHKNRIFYNKGLSRTYFSLLAELSAKYGNKYNSLSFHSYIK